MLKVNYSIYIFVYLFQYNQIHATPAPQQNYNSGIYSQRPVFNSYNIYTTNIQQQDKHFQNNNQRSFQQQQQQQCGDTFCEFDENYPSDSIANSKDELTKYSLFFDDDATVEVGPRLGGDSTTEQGLCDSRIRTIYPKTAENKHGVWKTVVNNDQFRQGINVEECRNKGSNCQFYQLFPTGTISTCKQHYTTRSLIVYNKDGTFSKDHFSVPSCCKCVIVEGGRRYNSVSSRIAEQGNFEHSSESTMFTFSS